MEKRKNKDANKETKTEIRLDGCSVTSYGGKITVTGGSVTVLNAVVRRQVQGLPSESARH